jgi:hypothetical protein
MNTAIQIRPKEVKLPQSTEKLTKYIENLAASGFFGKVTVSFQNGKVCDVRIEQTKKLDEL